MQGPSANKSNQVTRRMMERWSYVGEGVGEPKYAGERKWVTEGEE